MSKLNYNLHTKNAVKVHKYTKIKEKKHIDKKKIYDVFQSYASTGKYSVTEATSLTAKFCKVSIRTVYNARTFFDKGTEKIEQLEINLNLLKKEVEEIKKQINKNKKQLNKTE